VTYRVEFKVPGSDRWESAYGTFDTEREARKAMRANKRELRAEGNPVGKFRVVEGRGSAPPFNINSINWVQWGFIGLLGYLIFKKDGATA